MIDRYIYNILGCLSGYHDERAARAWLDRCHGESPAEFGKLVQALHDWFIENSERHNIAVMVLKLLAEFDPAGDGARRAQLADSVRAAEREQHRRIAEDNARAERRRLEAEREQQRRVAEAEWERLVAVRRAAAEQARRVAEAERCEAEAKLNRALESLRARFRSDYLGAEAYFREMRDGLVTRDLFEQEKTAFVKEWVAKNVGDGARDHGASVDDEQASAIGAVFRHVRVQARAGSGKTRTLVNRAVFLIKHCGVAPTDLLLLAFNKKAAQEMKDRVAAHGCPCPHVMTFHALAFAIVHPEEALVYDDPNKTYLAQSSVLQQVVNDLLASAGWHDRVRQLMLDHFRNDWESLVRKGLDRAESEGLEFRRALVSESLRGDYVKSFGEKCIANFLFEHDVPYLYERNHWWKGRNYRPDFTLEGNNVVIEYFGMQGNSEYEKESDAKRVYWAKKEDWNLLEYGPHLLRERGPERLNDALRADLERLGIPLSRLSEDELWRRIRERTITRFATVMRNFVGRCRKAGLSQPELQAKFRSYQCHDEIERRFLTLGAEVLKAYLNRLEAEGKEDFDGLLERAAALVESGQLAFDRKSGAGDLNKIRFIMVDEFQDFAPLFNRLLTAIRQHNQEVQIYGVGDDWQAINAFAGSDLSYFREFDSLFEPATMLNITTNYRSADRIVAVANRIMAGRGAEARPRYGAAKGRVLLADVSALEPAPEERNAWANDQITAAVRRLIREPLEQKMTVALLARRDGVPYFVPTKSRYPLDLDTLQKRWTTGLSDEVKSKVVVSTVHSYKGLEADVVVVLDAVERSFPLIHPDWVLAKIFGDSIDKLIDDEQRLFYVACSRPLESLIILTEKGRESPFLSAIRSTCEPVEWANYPTFCPSTGDWIVKVGSCTGYGSKPTYERKRLLRAHDFNYYGGDWPHWARTYDGAISVDELLRGIQSAAWLEGPDGLEIQICTSQGLLEKRMHVASNQLVVDGSHVSPSKLAPPDRTWNEVLNDDIPF